MDGPSIPAGPGEGAATQKPSGTDLPEHVGTFPISAVETMNAQEAITKFVAEYRMTGVAPRIFVLFDSDEDLDSANTFMGSLVPDLAERRHLKERLHTAKLSGSEYEKNVMKTAVVSAFFENGGRPRRLRSVLQRARCIYAEILQRDLLFPVE